MNVLIEEALLVEFDHVMDFERLSDHRCDDSQELHGSIVIAVLLVSEHRGEGAACLAAHVDRHADEGDFILADAPCLWGPSEEQWLVTGLRDDHVLAALDHPAGDAFTEPVPGALAVDGQPTRGFDVDFPGVFAQQHDRAADESVMVLKDLEDPMKRSL